MHLLQLVGHRNARARGKTKSTRVQIQNCIPGLLVCLSHNMIAIVGQSRLPFYFISLLVIMLSLSTKAFQVSNHAATRLRSQRFMAMSTKTYQLVLVRHGESTWNDLNKFTGWYDCPLSQKGEQEAISAGKLLKAENFHFDLAYTSYLQRAIKTLWHTLEQTGHMYIPIKNAWQLNER